jgi:hypothetical protein
MEVNCTEPSPLISIPWFWFSRLCLLLVLALVEVDFLPMRSLELSTFLRYLWFSLGDLSS